MLLPLRLVYRLLFFLLYLVRGIILVLYYRVKHGKLWHSTDQGQQAISVWMRKLCFRLGIRIRQHGIPLDRHSLFVANHISFLDIPVIACIVPVRFLSKNTVKYWPLFGQLTAMSGTVFIQRGKRSVMARVIDTLTMALDQKRPVAIFPEGTTTSGKDINKFHSGLFQAAINAKRPIQPVAIRYVHDGKLNRRAAYIDNDMFLVTLFKVMSSVATHVEVVFCPPVDAYHQDRQALSKQIRQEIEQSFTLPELAIHTDNSTS